MTEREVMAAKLFALRDTHPHFDTQGLIERDCLEIADLLLASPYELSLEFREAYQRYLFSEEMAHAIERGRRA